MHVSKFCLKNILLQEAPVSHLSGSFANGRISQTYLFSGLKSTGRFRTALSFASLLQCQSPVRDLAENLPDACGVCDSCRRIEAGSHPDVRHITPDGYEIRIDQVRAMQETAVLKPTMGNWQIFIIDPADRLNTFSANSLLKILEEAPSYVVFILIAGGTSAVLPTILSRSEIVRFQVPSHESARQQLVKSYSLTPQQASRIYSWSEGRFGSAVSLAAEDFQLKHEPAGISESHADFLNELEGFSLDLQSRFDEAGGLDEALRMVVDLENGMFVPLQVARKEFCRSLVMSAGLPASFPLMFSQMFLDRLDQAKKQIRRTFDGLMTDARSAYSPAMIKEIDAQINSALSAWVLGQVGELFSGLFNWYSDALRWAGSEDETLLLNLDRKDDIITLAEVDSIDLLRQRIGMLEESIYLINRYVQPSLVIENVLTQIGGPEA
jgi:DNA polymerase III delta' subunit